MIGLYFNKRNEKGLGRMSRERFNELYDKSEIPLILASMPQARKHADTGPKEHASETFTSVESGNCRHYGGNEGVGERGCTSLKAVGYIANQDLCLSNWLVGFDRHNRFEKQSL